MMKIAACRTTIGAASAFMLLGLSVAGCGAAPSDGRPAGEERAGLLKTVEVKKGADGQVTTRTFYQTPEQAARERQKRVERAQRYRNGELASEEIENDDQECSGWGTWIYAHPDFEGRCCLWGYGQDYITNLCPFSQALSLWPGQYPGDLSNEDNCHIEFPAWGEQIPWLDQCLPYPYPGYIFLDPP